MAGARGMRKAAGVAALALAVAAGETPSPAAVRLCEAMVSSGPVAGASEQAARKAALDIWKSKAAQHGERYASWRLAGDKFLECLPGKESGYECLARGLPCTIEQAPDRRELREKRLGV